jgi:hypothetical protein
MRFQMDYNGAAEGAALRPLALWPMAESGSTVVRATADLAAGSAAVVKVIVSDGMNTR